MREKSIEELQEELERLRRGREGGGTGTPIANFNNGREEGKLSPKEELLRAKHKGELYTTEAPDPLQQQQREREAYIEERYEKELQDYGRESRAETHTAQEWGGSRHTPTGNGFGERECDCIKFTDPVKYQPGLAGALSFMSFGIGGYIYLEEYQEAVKAGVLMILAYISVMFVVGLVLLPIAYYQLTKKAIELAEMKNKLVEDRYHSRRHGKTF